MISTARTATPFDTTSRPALAPRVHAPQAAPDRGRDGTPRSSAATGRFGRMFRAAPVYAVPRAELLELGARMADEEPAGENPAIPAGYAYLAQFVDHDATFDPASSLARQRDPDALHHFRVPRLDLDGLYGRGPAEQPYLYDDADPARLRVAGDDVPRLGDTALIGDARNDGSLVLSQLHVVFLRLHNAMVEEVRDEGHAEPDVLPEAQRRVRWHYQWVVLNDLLPRLCGEDVVHDLLHREEFVVTTGWAPGAEPHHPADPGHPMSSTTEVVRARLRFFAWREQPFIPLEYAVAASRFGHAMARSAYAINDDVQNVWHASLEGGRALPEGWAVDWKHFFRAAGEPHRPQPSGRIADRVAPAMRTHATLTLLRGDAAGLPSGQDVARAMSIDPLPAPRLGLEPLPALERRTPLWYYVLREAAELCDGGCLGPVGGRIVAETIVGLVAGDPLSYLRVAPGWTPTLPFAGDTFRMPDLIAVAQRG